MSFFKEIFKMAKSKADFDSGWKEIINSYFENFVAYCWPKKYSEIDWSRGYKFLDKELNKISRNIPIGKKVVDKLIEVYRKDGQATLVILHIEVQGYYDKDFAERLFIYRYRLHDLYRKPVATLALLIDSNDLWRPNVYRLDLWDSYIEMGFSIIKLIDYKSRLQELEASKNPFAAVILVQLAALKKYTDKQDKLKMKINLTKRLYNLEFKKKDILNLYSFIDWVLALPEPLELCYHQAIEEIEEQLNVAYVTTAERIGIQKGMQQGSSNFFINQLQYKFQSVPLVYCQKVEQADTETLLKWGKKLLDSQKLEEVFNN